MIQLQHAVQLPRPPTIAFLSFSRFSSYSALSEGLNRLMSTVGSGPSSSETEATVPCSQKQSTAMSSCRQVMPGHTMSCQYKDLTNPAPILIRILSSKAANIATSRSALFSNAHDQGQEELAVGCSVPLIMSPLPPSSTVHTKKSPKPLQSPGLNLLLPGLSKLKLWSAETSLKHAAAHSDGITTTHTCW